MPGGNLEIAELRPGIVGKLRTQWLVDGPLQPDAGLIVALFGEGQPGTAEQRRTAAGSVRSALSSEVRASSLRRSANCASPRSARTSATRGRSCRSAAARHRPAAARPAADRWLRPAPPSAAAAARRACAPAQFLLGGSPSPCSRYRLPSSKAARGHPRAPRPERSSARLMAAGRSSRLRCPRHAADIPDRRSCRRHRCRCPPGVMACGGGRQAAAKSVQHLYPPARPGRVGLSEPLTGAAPKRVWRPIAETCGRPEIRPDALPILLWPWCRAARSRIAGPVPLPARVADDCRRSTGRTAAVPPSGAGGADQPSRPLPEIRCPACSPGWPLCSPSFISSSPGAAAAIEARFRNRMARHRFRPGCWALSDDDLRGTGLSAPEGGCDPGHRCTCRERLSADRTEADRLTDDRTRQPAPRPRAACPGAGPSRCS